MKAVTPDQKAKLKNVIEQGIIVLQDVQDMREGLKDTVDKVAEELEIKPAIVNRAIRVAFKRNLSDQKNEMSDVEDVLVTAGYKV